MILKRIVILVLFCCLLGNYAYGQRITIKSIESRLITHQGVEFIGELKDKNKDHYSFPNWSNEGVLFLNNTKYVLSNINFNVSANCFESRIDRKKLFAFKNSTIDSVTINNHLFKKIDNYFYEVLIEKGDYFLLKKHDIKYHKGSINRLDLSVGPSFTSLVYKYLVRVDDEFKLIQLNKKSIIGLLDNKKNQELLVEFAKEQKLSFKNEKDVTRILEFIFVNSSLTI